MMSLAYIGPGAGFLFHGPVPWIVGAALVALVLRLLERRRRKEAE